MFFKKFIIFKCTQFYTLIPQYFGMKAPPPINTLKLVEKKQRMLEELGYMSVASKVLFIHYQVNDYND